MQDFEYVGILTARLSQLPPEAAAEALRERNQKRREELGDSAFYEYLEVEEALLARREPLIDLGLAQYGVNTNVLRELYQRSLVGTGDAALDMGIRIAALANRLAPQRFFETNPVVDDEELQRLAAEGTEEEMKALLANPMTREYVAKLFGREPPFDAIDDERFHTLMRASILNPRLAFDESTMHGPDLKHMYISNGIYNLLSTVPVTVRWLWTLDDLLFNYMPASTHSDKNVLQVIDRWRAFVINETGRYTELNMADEFCCRVAAMFGTWLGDDGFKRLGTPGSEDVILRCAHYGNHDMNPKEMKAANQKDGAVFTFAFLHNSHLYWNRTCRAALEPMLGGYQADLYATFCKKMAALKKGFDPKPVSDDFEIEEEKTQADPASQIRESIGLLEGRIAAIQKDASTAKTLGVWCLLFLAAVLWYLK
jgi:hypothetical protein